jgi:hypothetical protein
VTGPTVYLRIGPSALAFGDRLEILETTGYLEDGSPDWSSGRVLGERDLGGPAFTHLANALHYAAKVTL